MVKSVKNINLASRLIWTAYGVLALAIGFFAITIHWIRPGVGAVFLITILLGACGTAAGLLLLVASMLGTLAMVQQKTMRRTFDMATVLAGWLGALIVCWIAWGRTTELVRIPYDISRCSLTKWSFTSPFPISLLRQFAT
jgi:hypothetical protein